MNPIHRSFLKVAVGLRTHASVLAGGLFAFVAAGRAPQAHKPTSSHPTGLTGFVTVFSRLDGSVETTNEILDSASHDCPLVTQTYSTAVAKGTHMPASPTRLGKGCDTNLEGKSCQHLRPRLVLGAFRPQQTCRPAASCWRAATVRRQGQAAVCWLLTASRGYIHFLPL